MHVDDGVAESGVLCHDGCSYLLGFVGGVVEELDLQLIFRILHGADGFEQSIDDELLVVDRQLDRDPGQFRELGGRLGVIVLAMLEVEIDELVAMDAVNGQDDHHCEIREQEGSVKGVPFIEALEGLVGVLRFEEVAESVLGCKEVAGSPLRQPGGQAGEGTGDRAKTPMDCVCG